LTLALLPIAALAGGALYESAAAARDARRFPPPGTMVDVGGRRLHLVCIGTGRPIVLFEASGFGGALSFVEARTALAAQTTVCSYDRMGSGWSDPGPRVVTAGLLADDLRRLQDRAPLEPPLVVVASSIGGLTTELFARRYPERVAGLVFADAANSEMLGFAHSIASSLGARAGCDALVAAGRLGVVRLIDPFDLRRSTLAGADRSAAVLYGSRPWVVLCGLVRGLSGTEQELDRAPPLRSDVPIVVLTAERSDGLLPPAVERWLTRRGAVDLAVEARARAQERLARRSTRGSWAIVRGSDHLIAGSRPDAIVDAVREMLQQVREPRHGS
jgi:pimeloyl-ACP methyl ester carboxylesterase